MVFRAMDPFFMASNCSFALQNYNIAKAGHLKLTNGQWYDVHAFMAILFKWRGEKLESPLELIVWKVSQGPLQKSMPDFDAGYLLKLSFV